VSLRVLVTCPQMQRTIEQFRPQLESAGIETDLPPVVQALSESELIPIIGQYDGMIAGDDELSAPVIDEADRMRVISKWGVGVDGIDRRATARRGIAVTNTPGMFGEEVADVAMGYVTMLARGLHLIDRSVRQGGWDKPVGMSLTGQTLGIVGLGSIGQALARRGHGYGMDIVGFEIAPAQRSEAEAAGVELLEFDELLRRSRFVALCCPLTVDNRHLLGERALNLMRSDAYLVNTARGPLVDEKALASALAAGEVAGAALDVFEVEPLPVDSPLRRFDSVILGSHNGSNTEEATLRTSARAVENLIRSLAGR
jgi:D-3-phosphoglycerate dehydrogenase